MKSLSLFACLAVLVGPRALAAGSCCPAPSAAASPAAETPLPTRSVYQLESGWTNDRGEAFTLTQLRGQPVVIALFFANCSYACPLLVQDMKRLRDALPAELRAQARFVLASFDPARDTPAALAAYRERAQLDEGWTLLHGDAATVQELAMVLGVKYAQDATGQFSHSNLITVLNRDGEVAHQRAGLQGEVDTAARAVALAAQ